MFVLPLSAVDISEVTMSCLISFPYIVAQIGRRREQIKFNFVFMLNRK